MAIHFNYTSQFEEARSQIEQYLYDSVLAFEKDQDSVIRSVDQFSKAIDRLTDTYKGVVCLSIASAGKILSEVKSLWIAPLNRVTS